MTQQYKQSVIAMDEAASKVVELVFNQLKGLHAVSNQKELVGSIVRYAYACGRADEFAFNNKAALRLVSND